ncbi:hypothetical protein C8R45DRAFT_1104381 [Mycena sanguinolenta]|nr:hypothetical protein C8R45DRAFT_1104381 [Mycena sanguinolenta]
MSEVLPPDLAVLCQTSSIIRNIATPLLYRAVELSTNAQVEAFSRTILSPIASSSWLSSFVRTFAVTKLGINQDSVHFTALFDRAYFPNLTRFIISVNSPTPVFASLVGCCVSRHPTITVLGFFQGGAPQQSDPIQIPDLSGCSGLGAFVSFILREKFLYAILSFVSPDSDETPSPQPDTVESLTWNNLIWNIRDMESPGGTSRVGIRGYSIHRNLEYGIALWAHYSFARVAQNGKFQDQAAISRHFWQAVVGVASRFDD